MPIDTSIYRLLQPAVDLLRSTLRQQKGVGELLNEESVFIEAFETLVDQAVKQGKQPLVDFLDLLSGSLGGSVRDRVAS